MISAVSSAVNWVLGSVTNLGTSCSQKEIDQANQVKTIHDLVEEVAYQAFAKIVSELDIHGDNITEVQSGKILSAIKCAAHVEMYKPTGYIKERTKLLDPTQVQEVIRKVGLIVHDRDTKLTDARYYTLTDLLMGLDDHNAMVKEVLLKSWYKCPKFVDPEHRHLEERKANVNFYASLNEKLGFDLKASLQERKQFWDKYFPGKRVASTETSQEFVNILEVRHYFGGSLQVNANSEETLEMKFVTHDKKRRKRRVFHISKDQANERLIDNLGEREVKDLFEPRQVSNLVRKCNSAAAPLLRDKNMTVGQFFNQYFPEKTGNLSIDIIKIA